METSGDSERIVEEVTNRVLNEEVPNDVNDNLLVSC